MRITTTPSATSFRSAVAIWVVLLDRNRDRACGVAADDLRDRESYGPVGYAYDLQPKATGSWSLVSGRSPIADNQERNQRAQAQQEKSVGEGRSVEGIEGVEGSSSALPAGCEKGAEERWSTTAP